MSVIKITYEEAKQLYPKQVAEVVQKLRNSKARDKNTHEKDMRWEYFWGQRIDGSTPTLKHRLNNTIVHLEGRVWHWGGTSLIHDSHRVVNGPIPQQLVQIQRQSILSDIKRTIEHCRALDTLTCVRMARKETTLEAIVSRLRVDGDKIRPLSHRLYEMISDS